MLETVLLVVGMSLIGLISMTFCAAMAKRGKFGVPLTIVALTGGALAILFYGTNGTIGLDPIQSYAIALIAVLPAFLGSQAGLLLGWMIWKRRQRRAPEA